MHRHPVPPGARAGGGATRSHGGAAPAIAARRRPRPRPVGIVAAAAPDGNKPPSSAAAASNVPYAEFFGASSTAALEETKNKKPEAPKQQTTAPQSPSAAAALAARAAQAAVVAAAAARRGPSAAPVALPDWASPSQPNAEKLRARARSGAMVYAAAVQEEREEREERGRVACGGGNAGNAGDWRVAVCVSALDAIRGGALPGQAPHLHWGLYRARGSTWRLPPDAALPANTKRDPATGAARTPMVLDARRPGVWTAELRVPRRYAPVQLGFALWYSGEDEVGEGKEGAAVAAPAAAANANAKKKKKTSLPLPPSLRAAVQHAASGATGGALRPSDHPYPHYDPSQAGTHFALPLGVGRGAALPLGPSVVAFSSSSSSSSSPTADVNFAVYSRHAGAMTLCILRRPPEGEEEENEAEEERANSGGSASGAKKAGGGYLEIPLDPSAHRTGDVWHVLVRNLRSPQDLLYGWRADGPAGTSWMAGGCFHPGFLLLDPYAPAAALARLPPDEALLAAGAPALPPTARSDGVRHALMGSFAPLLPGSPSDPGGWAAAARLAERVATPASAAAAAASAAAPALASRRPRRPLSSSVLVEVDLREFSSSSPDPTRRGTYLGALERLDELAAAGATAVLLRGALLSDRAVAAAAGELEGEEDEERRNGGLPPPARRPLSYFAPEVALCCADEPEVDDAEGEKKTKRKPGPAPRRRSSNRQDAAAPRQLKALIAAAHARGLEVMLEADFCLTADAAGGGTPGAGARLQSLAGLDGAVYLRGGGGYRGGGVLNAGQPAVRALALAALRRWAAEYRADGFVLPNAENLAQDASGSVQDSPPFAEELAADGALGAFRGAAGGGKAGGGAAAEDDAGGIKVIASVSDRALLPRGGGRGFPHYGRLAEWNARFGEDALALLRDNGAGAGAEAAAAAGGGGGGGGEGGGARGGPGNRVLSAFATRLAGSPDLFAPAPPGEHWPGGLAAGRAPAWGLNALQPPGSARAPRDLFSASAAGGDGAPSEQEEETLVVARSFLLAQAVAAGVPALDWRALEAREAGGLDLARFASVVLALRRRYRALLVPSSFDPPEGQRDLRWHAAYGPSGAEPDWSGDLAAQGGVPGANFIAFSVFGGVAARNRGDDGGGEESEADDADAASAAARPWEVPHTHHQAPNPTKTSASRSVAAAVYVAFNPDPLADVALVPPPPPKGMRWRRLVDTSRRAPDDAVIGGRELLVPGFEYLLARRAALMLDAVPEAWVASSTAAAADASAKAPASSAAAAPPADDAAKRAARYLS